MFVCSSSCGDLDIMLATVDCLDFCDVPYYLVIHITTIGIRVMASKMTTMKFEVEKFDRKNNFLM